MNDHICFFDGTCEDLPVFVKAAFIRELTQKVADDLVKKCDRMPADWSGHELRQLLADKFDEQVSQFMNGSKKRELRKYALNHNI